MEKWSNNEVLYEGKIVTLRVGDAQLDDGSTAKREVVEHSGGVAIVPFDGEHVYLVKQYRIAIDKTILELPAGRIEPGDTPETRALAELEEEVGLRAGRLLRVASCYCSPGFCTELDHVYLAFDLEHVPAQPEPDERIEVVRLTLDEIRKLLDSHDLEDAMVIIGLHELLAHLDKKD